MILEKLFYREIKPKDYTREEAIGQIREGKSTAEACGYALDKLHCKGCPNACLLTKVRCDLGMRVVAGLEKPLREEEK